MKLLAIGPGQSTIELGNQLTNLNKDIKTLGLHRVFPFLKEEFDIDIDYWTWGDPEAIEKGINYIKENSSKLTFKTIISEEKDKLRALEKSLTYIGNKPGIIFCNYKDALERISTFLNNNNISHQCSLMFQLRLLLL